MWVLGSSRVTMVGVPRRMIGSQHHVSTPIGGGVDGLSERILAIGACSGSSGEVWLAVIITKIERHE